jgi:hypothetical protein
MSPVLTRPPQASRTRPGRDIIALLVGGIAAVGIILGVLAAVEGPAYVDRLSIENATPYALEVEVAGADRDSWLTLGPVSPGERRSFSDVVDKGERWVARVSSAGVDGGEVATSRNDLERGGWVLTIPDEVTSRLAERGVAQPTPRR